MTYLTPERLASLKQYLADCANGMNQHTAWQNHQTRMTQEAPVPYWTKQREQQFFFLNMGEPTEYREIAQSKWLELANTKETN